jgi:NOL1/NOP2/fmu family ribosome biogenesis protein
MHQKISSKEIDQVKAYVNKPDDYYYFKVNEDWLAINRAHKESLNILQRHLYLKKSGVRVGKLMGKDLIPDHELALSTIINKDAVLQTELTYDQAIQYLRRDNIDLNPTKKGWSLMNYEGQALGWAKLLPNRINNYYPKEIRIFSSPPIP